MNRNAPPVRQMIVADAPGRPSSGEPSDPTLLESIARGDMEALRALYDRHAPWLLARLSRRCPDRTIVEDVVQDTFVAVWRRAGAYRGHGQVAAWLWGIGIRRLIDRFRKGRRAGLWPSADIPLRTHEVQRSAEDQVLLGIEYGDLGAALNRLSPELRDVLRATALDGLTTAEAAHLLGIPPGTVKTRLMRARAQLRESLA